jgi:hypothetical protein
MFNCIDGNCEASIPSGMATAAVPLVIPEPPLENKKTLEAMMPGISLCRPRTLMLLVWLMTAGCSMLPPPDASGPPDAQPPSSQADSQWWQARFRLSWPAGAHPAWHLDPYLAHRVISPVLSIAGEDIPLWRFHRRANRDDSGHQFSFLFYARPGAAETVFSAIRKNPRLGRLEADGQLDKLLTGSWTAAPPGTIEATSDPQWPLAVQKAWPHYIMGASILWLDLIDQVSREGLPGFPAGPMGSTVDDYVLINREVTRLWQEEGGHAFFHHLSAIFGYEPLFVVEKRLIRY